MTDSQEVEKMGEKGILIALLIISHAGSVH